MINGNDTLKVNLERPPLYIGGSSMLFEFFIKNFVYPASAIENGVQGKVLIVFSIDENGKTSDHRILKGIDSECDEEALRLVKNLKENWIPAIYQGKKVKVEYSFPINFKLE